MAKELKALLGFSDGSGLFLCDVIRHKGRLWLVPEWLEAPEIGKKRPSRIILLETLKHQPMTTHGADFVLNDPVPRAIFFGEIPPGKAAPYTVIEAPDILLQIPRSSGALH